MFGVDVNNAWPLTFEIETNITLSTIQNQEEQESELLREEIEIFEAMEEQFIKDEFQFLVTDHL
jgi:hypothetical protein